MRRDSVFIFAAFIKCILVGCIPIEEVKVNQESTDSSMVIISPSLDDSASYKLEIKMDSIIKYDVLHDQFTLSSYFIRSKDSLIQYDPKNIARSVVLNKEFDCDTFTFTNAYRGIKVTTLGRAKRKIEGEYLFALVFSSIWGNNYDLLLIVSDKFEVKALALGGWPGDKRFDYLFYQGNLNVLTEMVYMRRVYIDKM